MSIVVSKSKGTNHHTNSYQVRKAVEENPKRQMLPVFFFKKKKKFLILEGEYIHVSQLVTE